LLIKAWEQFKKSRTFELAHDFEQFKIDESDWLNDFALYEVLRSQFSGLPWYEWPDEFRFRNREALEKLLYDHSDVIDRIKFIQFVFSLQWKKLKTYCNDRGVQLFGDLPFYVNHDSVDVWAHRELFSLEDSGAMKGVAGVPPDYFSKSGQLWGMPVFLWDVLKDIKYDWWIRRIKKNFQLYDVVRLDHFRAFVDYWEVPAADKDATGGQWRKGPGVDFFNTLKENLHDLPFVAEDLGEITPGVFALRDHLNLPGMKVLHFAFGEDIGQSMYAPHNYTDNFVVYTGTHDNNTTRGWFRKDLSDGDRAHVRQYIGKNINEKNVANEMIRLAYSSVARMVIVPMQDILNLDEKSRINTPSSVGKNWVWRMKEQPSSDIRRNLLVLTRLYNR
jgi:4-alpha-glucanotransferase